METNLMWHTLEYVDRSLLPNLYSVDFPAFMRSL